MSNYDELSKEGAANNALLARHCPEVMTGFVKVSSGVLKENSLTLKTKELVALGIAIAVRCEGCILAHVRNSIKAGATIEELAEVVEVAIIMGGGPSSSYGGKALSIAEHVFNEDK